MNVGRESPVSGHRHINQQLGTEIGMDIGPKKKEEEEIRKKRQRDTHNQADIF